MELLTTSHGAEPRTYKGAADLLQLLDVVEEAQYALLKQLRGTFVVVEQAVVSEQMPIAGIQEQLRALDGLNELSRGGEVFHRPLVGLHHVDLERHSRRP